MFQPLSPAAVEERPFDEQGLFPEHLSSATHPVVLRGFVEHWPIVQAAQRSDAELLGYLGEHASDRPVTLYRGKPDNRSGGIGYASDFSGFSFDRDSAALPAALTLLAEPSQETLYIGSTRIDQWLPGMRADNDIRFLNQKPIANFWLGTRTTIAAHCDSPQNIACCIAGERTFTLFPPEQVRNLYLGPVDLTPSGRAISLVDFENPDFERFPRFRDALLSASQVTLAPGDALFIPSLWWHRVASHAPLNMLINYWWKDSPDHMGIPDLALEHAILALRGLPRHQRDAWKAMFEHYVFGDYDEAMEAIPENLRGMLDADNEKAAQLGWLNFSRKLNQ